MTHQEANDIEIGRVDTLTLHLDTDYDITDVKEIEKGISWNSNVSSNKSSRKSRTRTSDTIKSKSKSGQINLNELNSVHLKSLRNGENNNNHNTRKIVNILGGIDKILTNYINIMISINDQFPNNTNKSLILLSPEQIKEIYHIIQQEQNVDIDEEIELNHSPKYRYCFYTHNTFIYKCFRNKQFANKLMSILYNKITIIIQCALNFLYPTILVILTRFSSYNNPIYSILELALYIIFSLYFLFQLANVNNYAFNLIYRKTFEFWLKIIYTILLCTSYGIYELYFNDNQDDIISILSLVFQIISVLLMVILLCCIDSLQFPSILKFLGGLALSVMLVVMSIYYTVTSFSINSNNNTNNNEIALTSFIGNASRIVAIYIIHHTYLSIQDPHKCVLLRYIPYIHWIDKYHLNPIIAREQQSRSHSTTTTATATSVYNTDEDEDEGDGELEPVAKRRETEILSEFIIEEQKHEQQGLDIDNNRHLDEIEEEEAVQELEDIQQPQQSSSVHEETKKEPQEDEAIDIQITSMDTNDSRTIEDNEVKEDMIHPDNYRLSVEERQNTKSVSLSANDIQDIHNIDDNDKVNDNNHIRVVTENDTALTLQQSRSVKL